MSSSAVSIPARIVSIQDLSCFGRSSLTVAIPTLSAMGYQVLPLPTAVLSTHTGDFTDFYMRDLSEDMHSILAHWSSLPISVEAICSGFLGNPDQAESVLSCIQLFRNEDKHPLVLIDPAMADNGALYQTVSVDMVRAMRRLCGVADIITPNLTEVMFLLDMPYSPVTRQQLPALLTRLRTLGAPNIAVTGIVFTDTNTIGTATLDQNGTYHLFEQVHIPYAYPGTGDIFASVLLGKYLSGLSIQQSADFASSFISKLITDTAKAGTPPREGVLLESHLRDLIL